MKGRICSVLLRGVCLNGSHCKCRVQAALGNLLAAVVPRARIVPAVRGEDMSGDQATVSFHSQSCFQRRYPAATSYTLQW